MYAHHVVGLIFIICISVQTVHAKGEYFHEWMN